MGYLTLVFLLLGISFHSRITFKLTFGTAGTTYENANNKLSYGIGEFVDGAMKDEGGTCQLGNGYCPSLDLTPLGPETLGLDFKIEVFPNLVSEALFITHPTEQYFMQGLLTLLTNKFYRQPAKIINLLKYNA